MEGGVHSATRLIAAVSSTATKLNFVPDKLPIILKLFSNLALHYNKILIISVVVATAT